MDIRDVDELPSNQMFVKEEIVGRNCCKAVLYLIC